MIGLQRIGIAATLALAVLGCTAEKPATAPDIQNPAAMAAHHICSGVFVVGRDYQRTPAQVLETSDWIKTIPGLMRTNISAFTSMRLMYSTTQ
jgi:hypothetical protein